MSEQSLLELARCAGLSVQWQDYRGRQHEVAPETLRSVLQALELPCADAAQCADSLARLQHEQSTEQLPPMLTARAEQPVDVTSHEIAAGQALRLTLESGESLDCTAEARDGRLLLPPVAQHGYHRLQLGQREIVLAVAPRRAFGVGDLEPDRRRWGLAAQLYSLRRCGDGGIGDFAALAELARSAARRGADALAISPVHALFSADLSRFSPYAPSSRLFLNPIYADASGVLPAESLAQLAAGLGLDDELRRLEALPLIDWPAAARCRLALLRAVFERLWPELSATPAVHPLAREFQRFRKQGGALLEDHARFEALHAEQVPQGRWHWRQWPQGYRDPRSRSVSAFAGRHPGEVGFHVFLQWLAQRGLAAAQAAARDAGMAVGLIADLAVGTDSGGSHAWSRPHDLLAGLSVGAPPDPLATQGQVWGLTALSPRALRLQGYAPFLDTLRAALRHAGGVRIDHVLGLQRLWLVPEGASSNDGAYLRYPLQDLLRLVALESVRHRAVIVGEDLGTVPEGFRDTLADAGIMGMRVLWFERDHGLFVDPSRWPAGDLATTSTHDLPTVAGWWSERDLGWRERLGLFADEQERAGEHAARAADRRTLWDAFAYAGVAAGELPAPAEPAAAVSAAIRFVARTPAPLALVPLEDLAGLDEQPNLPGTIEQHPNWRRRLPAAAESLLSAPEAAARLDNLAKERNPR